MFLSRLKHRINKKPFTLKFRKHSRLYSNSLSCASYRKGKIEKILASLEISAKQTSNSLLGAPIHKFQNNHKVKHYYAQLSSTNSPPKHPSMWVTNYYYLASLVWISVVLIWKRQDRRRKSNSLAAQSMSPRRLNKAIFRITVNLCNIRISPLRHSVFALRLYIPTYIYTYICTYVPCVPSSKKRLHTSAFACRYS